MRLIFSSRLLIAVACVTMLLNWVNTNGENLLFRVVQDFLGDEARRLGIEAPTRVCSPSRLYETTAFYGSFYFWVNCSTLVLQSFVASRLLKYGGFGVMLLFAPTISLIAYSGMALVPILAVVKAMKVVDNATDYSISNTARNVLWLPVPARIKLKAKPAVDSLFARAGDGLCGADRADRRAGARPRHPGILRLHRRPGVGLARHLGAGGTRARAAGGGRRR